MKKNDQGKWVYSSDIAFYLCKNKHRWVKFEVLEVFCHPKHNSNHLSGFDYAIAMVNLKDVTRSGFDSKSFVTSDKIVIDTKSCFLSKEDALKAKNCKVKIAGYPGEFRGTAYQGLGEVVDVVETELGGQIAYYTVFTSGGMSGSPVSA